MGRTAPASPGCSSPWDRFPFAEYISHKDVNGEGILQKGETTKQASYTKNIAKAKTTVDERAKATIPTLTESRGGVSNPLLSGSWMEVARPDLQEAWIDGPPEELCP